MSKSLQDQLMALGLAREKQSQANQLHEKNARVGRSRANPARKASGSQPQPRSPAHIRVDATSAELSLEEAYRMRERQMRQQGEAAREKKRQEDLERQRLNNAIRDLVMLHRLNDETAELARHFLYKGRIRKVRVNPDQLKGLNEGTLGLVYLSGGYHILASDWVRAVGELSREHVPDLSGGMAEHGPGDEEFPVPDDLVW